MDYLSQILANPNQKRTVTIKTEPEKRPGPPEAPLSPESANLPQGVLDMMMMGQAQKPALPPGMLQGLLMGAGGGNSTPPPMIDPMAGQIPMAAAPTFNPYGG